MYRCSRHEINHASDECPRCEAESRHEALLEATREAQEDAQRQHEEFLEAQEASDHRRANPGNHQCPHCGYVTLLFGFDRCSQCHGNVKEKDPEFWIKIQAQIDEAKRVEAARRAEKARKDAEAAAQRQAEYEARAKEDARKREAEATNQRFSMVILVALLLVAAFTSRVWFGWIAPLFTPSQQTSTTAPDSGVVAAPAPSATAPDTLVDRDVCPYEGCAYGERWLARRGVPLYSAPPDTPDTARTSLRPVATVSAGAWVTTETGLVLSRKRQGTVVGFRGRESYGVDSKQPPIRNGDAIPIYSSLGEGCWRAWAGGEFFVLCAIEVPQGTPGGEWWVRVKTANGTTGWLFGNEGFASQEALNSEAASLLEDTALAQPELLTRLDALMREGAQLNGEGVALSGQEPLFSAVIRGDPALLQALIERGLDVRSTRRCVADTALAMVLGQERGEELLTLLVAERMPLTCAFAPPFDLVFGRLALNASVMQSVDLDRAERIGALLVRAGANPRQRDSAGQSILDTLNNVTDPNARPRALAFKERLEGLR